ncbi:MAG: hypothetical protein MK108_15590 [Mariniblastus sp.]|nr:hypothetical protein [Mariniblastus sp.]
MMIGDLLGDDSISGRDERLAVKRLPGSLPAGGLFRSGIDWPGAGRIPAEWMSAMGRSGCE